MSVLCSDQKKNRHINTNLGLELQLAPLNKLPLQKISQQLPTNQIPDWYNAPLFQGDPCALLKRVKNTTPAFISINCLQQQQHQIHVNKHMMKRQATGVT